MNLAGQTTDCSNGAAPSQFEDAVIFFKKPLREQYTKVTFCMLCIESLPALGTVCRQNGDNMVLVEWVTGKDPHITILPVVKSRCKVVLSTSDDHEKIMHLLMGGNTYASYVLPESGPNQLLKK